MKAYQTSVGRYFFLLSFASIILAGLILYVVALYAVNSVKKQDTKEFLSVLAKEAEYTYDWMDETDKGYYIKDDKLYCGNFLLNGNYTIIDRIKDFSNIEMTFFCKDLRVATTITDARGDRLINTTATEVWKRYVYNNQDYFSDKVKVDGQIYYGYYKPIKSSTKEIVGMVFAGLPAEGIKKTVGRMQRGIVIACICISIFALVVALFATTAYMKKQTIIMDYLTEIDKEKFNHVMPTVLTKRKDEYGELSRHIEKINASLKVLIQRDGLTMLYNRRTIMNLLQTYFVRANEPDGETFSFAIGDIDFFKKVNDTYGHAAGDEVLKYVSNILQKNMENLGFAGRWGGEEFVLVFKGEIDAARKVIEKISEEIRSGSVSFEGNTISITMTFGIAQYRAPGKLDATISCADSLLYEGKENGRNQIVG